MYVRGTGVRIFATKLSIAFLVHVIMEGVLTLHSDTNCISFHNYVNPRRAYVADILKSLALYQRAAGQPHLEL